MPKRKTYEIRNEILMALKEESLVYSGIERKVDTNPNTVKMHVENLEKEGYVKIEKTEKDPSNGQPSFRISLTNKGLTLAKNLKK